LADEVKAAMDVVGVDEAFSFLKQADPERMRRERKLKRELAQVFSEYEEQYLDAVERGEQPEDDDDLEKALAAALITILASTYVSEVLRTSAEIGIAFDPALISQHALEWARTYSYELISGFSTTELTRAYSAATNEVREQLLASGLVMRKWWITKADERVCPICGPLHEQPETTWAFTFPDGPPAHVNCRCREELRPA
jgi:hypothetical protein